MVPGYMYRNEIFVLNQKYFSEVIFEHCGRFPLVYEIEHCAPA